MAWGENGAFCEGKDADVALAALILCWLGEEGMKPSSRYFPLTGLAFGVMPVAAREGRRDAPFLWAMLPAGVEGTVLGCADDDAVADIDVDAEAACAAGGTTAFHALLDDDDCAARRRKERMAD